MFLLLEEPDFFDLKSVSIAFLVTPFLSLRRSPMSKILMKMLIIMFETDRSMVTGEDNASE